ncbi:ArdC family protein [Marinococcus halotolerans]|uniref:ArdC family protein n=1 Tax=Marinococcus halotolerans TaxID=301092 RepID=UPI0003B6411A|nr:ArdC family protein [Marinococcus halotolerans]
MAYKRKSAETKRQEVEQLTEDRNSQVDSYFQSSENMKEYLNFMSKFYDYSVGNSTLIQKQFPGANAVGGFQFWKEQGFSVQKGEKGNKILVPTPYKAFEREENGVKQTVGLKQATKEEKAKIDNGEIPVKEKLGYKTGTVFDISQTNATADDLPKIFPNKWLEGSVENYQAFYDSMERYANTMNVDVLTEPMEELGAAKGQYIEYTQASPGGASSFHRAIQLNTRNDELQNVKTLIHEAAHAQLHGREKEGKDLPHSEKEFQAEMTAYTVATHFGLDTSDYSLDYLHTYNQQHDTTTDKVALLQGVKDTSYDMITHLEDDLQIENTYEEASTNELQERFQDYQVVTSNEVQRIGDMDEKTFRSTFEDNYGNNLLAHGDVRGETVEQEVQSFNQLDSFNQGQPPYGVGSDNYKIVDPSLEEPKAFAAWSEDNQMDGRLLSLPEMDKVLAERNMANMDELGYAKTNVKVIMPPDENNNQQVLSAGRLALGDAEYHDLNTTLNQQGYAVHREHLSDQSYLQDIYTPEAFEQTFENLAVKIQEHKEGHTSMNNSDAYERQRQDVQAFTEEHGYVPGATAEAIHQATTKDVQEHQQDRAAVNQSVQLASAYTSYQDHVTKEQGQDGLNEDTLLDRLESQNAYEALKEQAVDQNMLTVATVNRLEQRLKGETTTEKEPTWPFEQADTKSVTKEETVEETTTRKTVRQNGMSM